MREHGFDLLPCDSGEPLKKIVHRGPILEVFEERFDRNPSARESPRSTHPVGCPLHRAARILVKHQSNGIPAAPLGQAPTGVKVAHDLIWARSTPLRRVGQFLSE